ncbi:class II fructose-bisphosphate aldolase, partial [uncultured Campylobacter sp.]|uniref:class II fructose-bisphosphate aldolase n=1 Tax=uncultured Campylobacter sp. TaxID=218934 RepID=UPI002634A166
MGVLDIVKPGVLSGDDVSKVYAYAKQQGFAIPAVNVVGSNSINAVLESAKIANSPVIIQFSNGGAAFYAGAACPNAAVLGAIAGAHQVHALAAHYGVAVILHTDHAARKLLPWIDELIEANAAHKKAHGVPLFSSHMLDLSEDDLELNLATCEKYLEILSDLGISLEIELGVTGGEEDGVVGEINEKLYTSTADGIKTVEALGLGEKGRYITALTFGNVHGAYKPGHVKLRPELLGTIQKEVAEHFGLDHRPFDLVMHGGSGSTAEEIATAVANGVIKMNVDTDTQYAFTRPVVDHMMRNYDGVLKIDGEVGVKKQYDPRTWGKSAEAGMAARVVEACQRLGSDGT